MFCLQAEDGIRDHCVTGVQTCALPIFQRYAEMDLNATQRGAAKLRSNTGGEAVLGCEMLQAALPNARKELENGHLALTACQRYAGAILLESKARDVRDSQVKITPVLVGAAGWTP